MRSAIAFGMSRERRKKTIQIDRVRLQQCVLVRWGALEGFLVAVVKAGGADFPWGLTALRTHVGRGQLPTLAARVAASLFPPKEWDYITRQINEYTDPRVGVGVAAA